MSINSKRNLRITIIVLILMALMTWCGVRNNPDNIHHPDNEEFVLEIAWNLNIELSDVT